MATIRKNLRDILLLLKSDLRDLRVAAGWPAEKLLVIFNNRKKH
jgi:hypothetical protein